MGDWSSIQYIISQLLVVAAYVLAVILFNIKNRSLILLLLMISNIFDSAAYFLLDAWVGLGICAIAFMRNSTNLAFYSLRSEQDRKRIFPIDLFLLFFWWAAFITVTAFTYDGLLSLLPLIAILFFTFAAWQNNILVFKILSMPCSVCWIIYSVYIQSVMGYVLESILLAAIIFGLVRFIKKKGKKVHAGINAA